jgi:hypothetical protein
MACLRARSVGITLSAIGDGSVVDHNVISDAQSGIEISGNNVRVTNNLISDIDLFDGIDLGLVSNSLIDGNTIFNVTPLTNESCGIYEISGADIVGNTISNTTVNDAYCGVLYITVDQVGPGNYYNTLYTTLNGDLLPSGFPPPSEPQQMIRRWSKGNVGAAWFSSHFRGFRASKLYFYAVKS